MTLRALTALAALAAASALAAPAGAAPSERSARKALAHVQELGRGKGVRTGRELTPALSRLYAALPSLGRSDRAAAEALLARPDDSGSDPANTHKWSGLEAGSSPKCSDHFCVHWTMSGPDASTPAYAQSLVDLLEHEVYPCENGTAADACGGAPGLGWSAPAPDAGHGGDDRVDVYIEDLYTNERVFGYVALDPGQPSDPSVPHYAYMVLDNDYSRFGDGTQAYARAAEQVTAAHEYNHVLQNAYDYLEDTWMAEATAVYIEDEVYPSNNDYLRYVDEWVANMRQPLTAFPSTNLKAYGSAVWNHWLDHRFGASIVRAAWERSVGASNFAPAAYGSAIGAAGAAGFGDEFARFAAAVAEWDAPGAGFPDRYPDVPRDGMLPVESQTLPFDLPHTTFAFFDVPVPQDGPPVIRLTGTLPPGTSGAIGLVARTGADPAAGDVTTQLTPMPAGGRAIAELSNPAQYGRITAVVVNSDASQSGFDPGLDDYVFTKDATGVVATMSEPGPPVPTTGTATLISDHGAFVNASVDPHLIDTKWSIQYGRSATYGSKTGEQTLSAATVGSAAVIAPLHKLKANTIYHYRVVASNSAGITVGRDMFFRTARDVTAPRVRVSVPRQPLRTLAGRGLRYRVRCSERCHGTARIVLSRRVARRLHLPRTVARGRVTAPAQRSATLRLRPRSAVRRDLAAVTNMTGRLEIDVADDARNHRKAARRLRIRR